MRYDPEKGPNDKTRRPETRPGLAKPQPKPDLRRPIGGIAINGAQKDKGKK